MKVLSLIVCTFVVFGTAVNAWTESEKCDGHDGDSVNRRRIAMKAEVERKTETSHTQQASSNENKNLRGYNHRKLGADPTIETFQLKMHWEEDYCWQLEDFDRRWCMSCHVSEALRKSSTVTITRVTQSFSTFTDTVLLNIAGWYMRRR